MCFNPWNEVRFNIQWYFMREMTWSIWNGIACFKDKLWRAFPPMSPRVPTLRISSVAAGPWAEPEPCEGNSWGDSPQRGTSYGTYSSSAFELVSINSTVFFITGMRSVRKKWEHSLGQGCFNRLGPLGPALQVSRNASGAVSGSDTHIRGDGLVCFDSREQQGLLGLGFSW